MAQVVRSRAHRSCRFGGATKTRRRQFRQAVLRPGLASGIWEDEGTRHQPADRFARIKGEPWTASTVSSSSRASVRSARLRQRRSWAQGDPRYLVCDQRAWSRRCSIRCSTFSVSRWSDGRTLLWAPSLLPPGASAHDQSIVPVANTKRPRVRPVDRHVVDVAAVAREVDERRSGQQHPPHRVRRRIVRVERVDLVARPARRAPATPLRRPVPWNGQLPVWIGTNGRPPQSR